MFYFRNVRYNICQLQRIELRLPESGIGGCREHGDHETLILLRRQLAPGVGKQKIIAPEDDGGKHQNNRQGIERSPQQTGIVVSQPVKLAVDKIRESVPVIWAGYFQEA